MATMACFNEFKNSTIRSYCVPWSPDTLVSSFSTLYVRSCPIFVAVMSSEYITIRPELLDIWGGIQPHATFNSNDATESFDAQQVAIGGAGRALSVSIGALGRSRETGLETKANTFPSVEHAEDPRQTTWPSTLAKTATTSDYKYWYPRELGCHES